MSDPVGRPRPPRRTGIRPVPMKPLTDLDLQQLERLVRMSDDAVERSHQRQLYEAGPEYGKERAKQTREIVSYLISHGVPRSRKELTEAVEWITKPNAKVEDMPPQALMMDLVVGLIPYIGEGQATRDVWRDISQGHVSGWTALAAIGMVPILGMVSDMGDFARNVGHVLRGADITSGRALAEVIAAGERVGAPAVRVRGEVFFGANHQEALQKAMQKFGKGIKSEAVEGFVGAKAPFLTRQIAYEVMRRQGLVPDRPGALSSEMQSFVQGRPVSPGAQRALENSDIGAHVAARNAEQTAQRQMADDMVDITRSRTRQPVSRSGAPITEDSYVTVFHQTDDATADAMLRNGVVAKDKPRSLLREGYEAGEDMGAVQVQPGAGLGPGLYVSRNPGEVGYGRRTLAIRVKASELGIPPEQSNMGRGTGLGSLTDGGEAVLLRDIKPAEIFELDTGGKTVFNPEPNAFRPPVAMAGERPEVTAIRRTFPRSDDLRQAKFRGQSCSAGHCYAASEALYHMLGGKEAGWKPMHMKVSVDGKEVPHWFLQHESGEIIDLTADQFPPGSLDYSQAKGKGFQTPGGGPSARAREFMRRAGEDVAMPQIPLEAKSHLLVPALRDAPPEMQGQLLEEVQAALEGPNGEDLVAQIVGVAPESIEPGTGVWGGSRTPNSIYTYAGLTDEQSSQLAVAHAIARGQEAAAWWRVARAGEEATPGFVVRGLDAATHAKVSELAPDLGSTHLGEEAIFLNFEGDPDFEAKLTRALEEAGANVTLHGGNFKTGYIGSPEEFRSAFPDVDQYRSVVSKLTELTAPVYRASAEALSDVDRFNPSLRDYLNRIWPEERLARYTSEIPLEAERVAGMTPAARAKMEAIFEALPEARVLASGALAGIAKRGWYEASARAIAEVFGPEAPRFAALLASLSPQTSVETNLTTALEVWKNWAKAGRPTDPDMIRRIIRDSVMVGDIDTMPRKVLLAKMRRAVNEFGFQPNLPMRQDLTGLLYQAGIDELSIDELRTLLHGLDETTQRELAVLPGWINNTITSLTADNPTEIILSGPKVDSFMRNLLGDTERVTLDTWMAKLSDVHQKVLAGQTIKGVVEPGKGPGYMAYSARMREAADLLTRMTGEVWTPAEVQEAAWSWGKTISEMTGDVPENITERIPFITDELIRETPTFNELMLTPQNAEILSAVRAVEPELGVPPQIPMKGGTVPEGGIDPQHLVDLTENIKRYGNEQYRVGKTGDVNPLALALLGGGAAMAAQDDAEGGASMAGLGLLGLLGAPRLGTRVDRFSRPNRWRVPDLGYLGSDPLDVPTFLRRARLSGMTGEPSKVAQEYYRSRIFGGWQ